MILIDIQFMNVEWFSERAQHHDDLTHSTFDVACRFFTLIPHDFGMQKPPLLDNLDLIKVCETDILWEQFHRGLH